jgi:hypothetical protein
MKFEGIEIALEGMKTTAKNRCAGEGKGREKIAEASARLVSISVTNWRYL